MNTKQSPHFTSKSGMWATPMEFFNEMNRTFRFTLDACASSANATCERYFTVDDDALSQDWTGVVWMNPPYGRQIGQFMRKAYHESTKGATVVCLVPSRTDTRWWHDYAKQGTIIHLRGRLKFIGARHSAPFPSAIVIFWGGTLGSAVRTGLTEKQP